MAVPNFQYVGGDTILHRLHPLSKLLVLSLAILSLFAFYQWYVAAALCALVIALHLPRGIGLGRAVRVAKSLLPFVLIVLLLHIFLIGRSSPLEVRVLSGFLQGLRITTILVAAGLFLAVTDPIDLADAVMHLLRPLRRLRLRVADLAIVVMIVFSFLPLLATEASRLRTAHGVRCGFRSRGLLRVRWITPLLAPLVLSLFRRAEELELSMTARCFSFGGYIELRETPVVGRLDLAVCVLGVLLFLAGLYCATSN